MSAARCDGPGSGDMWGAVEGQCNATFRRTGARLWLTGCAALFALVPISGLFAAGPNGTEDPTLVQQAICLPVVLALVWTALGVARQGIWLRPDGVRVRNVYRSYDLPWRRIMSIDPPLAYGAWRNAGIQFRMSDGTTISASLYSAGPFNRSDFADDVVQALRNRRVPGEGNTPSLNAETIATRRRTNPRGSAS